MSKKLAIKGHPTRGKEVIELLEMMGGIADHMRGNVDEQFYYIHENGYIHTYTPINSYPNDNDFCKFTLEEFLEKFPFKVGDFIRIPEYESEVRICKMKWTSFSDIDYLVYRNDDEEWYTAYELLKSNAEFLVNKEKGEENGKMLCDITLRHLHRNHLKNVISELYEHIKTTPKEELEREFNEIESEGWSYIGPTVEEFMDFCNKVNKKPKYPKTYKDCRAIIDNFKIGSISGYKAPLLNNLQNLLVCRDAYWKIAGEQMGLDKPWEPDWNEETHKFTISNKCNKIYLNNTAWYAEVLSFPTAEMRDAFYENFKDLIERCKELL